MTRRAGRIGALVAATVLAGSLALQGAAAGERTEVDATLPTSQKRLPENVLRSIGRLALTEPAYERLWERFRLRGDRPPVHFGQRAVLFAGTGESGSCPKRYRGLSVNHERATFRIALKPPRHEVCTADFAPRTMAISVPRDDVPQARLHARYGAGKRFAVNRVRE